MFKKANMPVSVAAKALEVDPQTIRLMLQQGVVDWGKCWKRPGSRHYSYMISPLKFYQETGFLWEGTDE